MPDLSPDSQRLIETVRDHADALADIAVGWGFTIADIAALARLSAGKEAT